MVVLLGDAFKFKDHFSTQSDDYARYRPTYPDSLFEYLAGEAEQCERAWDCATGNGQVATALGAYFHSVIASDASAAQIDAAVHHPNVQYHVAKAEDSGIADVSIDLTTVGQAFHWFDERAFMAEASRVLTERGVLAIWCYELCTVNEACDAIVDCLYNDIVGEFWLPERVRVDSGYADLKMPGVQIEVPEFSMRAQWTVADMLGYLRTWSASKRFMAARGRDPVADIEAQLAAAWGTGAKAVLWPLAIRASRPNMPPGTPRQ